MYVYIHVIFTKGASNSPYMDTCEWSIKGDGRDRYGISSRQSYANTVYKNTSTVQEEI